MNEQITNKILTLPNLISFVRLLLVPVIAIVLVGYQNNVAAFVLFLIAASTDFLDGAVARATGQISRLGQQLDPFIDRVLILTAVILVFAIGRVPLWILVLLVTRDFCLFVLMYRLRAAGEQQFKVNFIGKAATAFNMAGFCSLILYWPELGGLGLFNVSFLPGWGESPALLGIWFLYIGVFLAWVAGIYYIVRARNIEAQPETQKRAREQYAERYGAGRASGVEAALSEQRANVHLTRISPTGSRADKDNSAWDRRNVKHASRAKKRTPQGNYPYARGREQRRIQGGVALIGLDTPKKLLLALAITVFLLLLLGFYGCDGIRNFGVIHQGVRVGTLSVGQMQLDEAAALIDEELTAIAMQAPVTLYASEAAAAVGITEMTVQLGNGVNDGSLEINTQAVSWSITPATLNAEVNGAHLAQEAYKVGRGGNFIFGRLAANMFGVTISPRLGITRERLDYLESLLTQSIGTPMQNATISFVDNRFYAVDGQNGFVVNSARFELMLQQAFFSAERKILVPMVHRPMQVDIVAARRVAESTQQAITEPVSLTYLGSSWQLTTEQLGKTISTTVRQSGSGSWVLVPTVDVNKLMKLVPGLTGQLEEQVLPHDAEFRVVDGELRIIPSQEGAGIDYKRLAQDLNAVLFGEEPASDEIRNSQARVVPMHIGVLVAEVQFRDLVGYDFSNKISEFTISYANARQESIVNIQNTADHINSSIVAPHEIWSLLEAVGEFTVENGFVDAQIIVNGTYEQGIGGGTCSAATTVFNAIWEAGYPIIERMNHSLRNERYPLGRDAAIAAPYADLQFRNDTDNYLLITMYCADDAATCTLWGISPGYRVETIEGELVESGVDFIKREVEDKDLYPGQRVVEVQGHKAAKIEVTRIVYYADGTVKEKRIFYSSYDSTTEITKVAPGELTQT